MKKIKTFAFAFVSLIVFGSFSLPKVAAEQKTSKIAFSPKAVNSDVTVYFSNSTYFNGRVTISNSSGFYRQIPAGPHSYGYDYYVPTGTYNISVEIDAYSPVWNYNYWFYVGSESRYGGTYQYFSNVTISSSLGVNVN